LLAHAPTHSGIEEIGSIISYSSHAGVMHRHGNIIVLASTHDGELQQLLRDSFDMFNFSDQVVDGKYGFDFIIRPGPAQSRNAIRLLELRGYPASVTDEAERTATSLSPPKRADSVNS
jgi:DNA mismatch repair ATPase MutS